MAQPHLKKAGRVNIGRGLGTSLSASSADISWPMLMRVVSEN